MSNKEIDVIFLFEKQGRELDVLCLLKALLEKKNLSVEIIQQNTQIFIALKNYKPRVVVLPFCYQNRSNNIYFRFWRSATYISLNWEQFFYPGNKIAKTPRGEFATQRVIHCAWSDEYINLLKNCGVPELNIRLIGSLPLSLLSAKYKDYFQNKETLAIKHSIDTSQKWIFFPENFGWAFYKDDMLDQMIIDGQKAEDVYLMRKFSDDSFREIIKWCVKLINEYDSTIILRPRPATSLEEMRQKIKEVIGEIPQKLIISKDMSVKDWINSSDYVISTYSTTLIEAAVGGKNIIMLEPYTMPDVLRQTWHPYVNKCKTYKEFEVAILDDQTSNYEQLRSWAISNLNLDLNPPEKIVEILSSHCCDSGRDECQVPIRDLIVGDAKPLSYIKYWISNVIYCFRIFTAKPRMPVCTNEYYEDFTAVGNIREKIIKMKSIIELRAN